MVEKKTLGEVQIRPMGPADISSVLEFDKRISDAQRAVTYDEPYAWDQGGSLESSFVAEFGNQVVGFILARIANPGEPIVGEGLIQAIGIDPEYQRKGIASRLVDAFLDQCRSKGIRSTHIIINENDSQLQSLFVSMGFSSGQLIDYTLKL